MLLVLQVVLVVTVCSFVRRIEPLIERAESVAELESREMDVPLPAASAAVPITTAPREVFINIDLEGRYSVNGQTLDAEALESLLMNTSANNREGQAVIIRADRAALLEHVVLAVNLCRQAGIEEYMVSTTTEESP